MERLVCPNCGAALQASRAYVDLITCQYCNVTFHAPKATAPESDLGKLILDADFRQKPIFGWDFPNKDNVQLVNGAPPELRFKYPAKRGLWYALYSSGFFDDVDASVNIKFYADSVDEVSAGIMLRFRKDFGAYMALISPLGTYTLSYYERDAAGQLTWKYLLNWTKHTALKPGLNEVNRLRFVAKKDRLHIYLNDLLATSVRDSLHEAGEVQLVAEASDKSAVEVGFTDLQLREARE
ncbi:MAG: hypothetical protein IT310_14180 [Anaerolineales bacterium]|nr:hypothetical protein [Anaerolineales bacterium]